MIPPDRPAGLSEPSGTSPRGPFLRRCCGGGRRAGPDGGDDTRWPRRRYDCGVRGMQEPRGTFLTPL